ncbi:class I SAM-dependent methyltransferase [Sinorhizobium saheli]|uniref:Methyltransferase n=1 Tax=Sinorhizobium saheli TaxID=36856 RepID=A0A178YEK1_SINSA|nr:class I SAM-dependent methyltransferase [Sinorhizobium saheli]MQW85552.1 methyltransferase domain-containing protein [Sinorhizobium saheli]OAP45861.1 methyltransferase [Sinorhizobium saheli]
MTERLSHADVAARWNQNADQWARDVRNGYDVYRDLFTLPAFQQFLPPLQGLEIVDFGCGEGTNTRRFAGMGARMTGIDISERMIEYARQMEEADPLGITYRAASYSADTGFPESSFDAVISTMALMDGPDFGGAMREAHRLLRPGGFLAFSVLHPCFITPGLRWEKDEEGRTISLRVSRYFDRADFTEYWRFGDRPQDEEVAPFAVPRFPRTISDYLNAIAAAGFRITRVEEPQPTPEACEAVPRFTRWRDLAAFLLLVMAERPA